MHHLLRRVLVATGILASPRSAPQRAGAELDAIYADLDDDWSTFRQAHAFDRLADGDYAALGEDPSRSFTPLNDRLFNSWDDDEAAARRLAERGYELANDVPVK